MPCLLRVCIDEGLFEGDNDVDEAFVLLQDTSIKLYRNELVETDRVLRDKGPKAKPVHLNNGIVEFFFQHYSVGSSIDGNNGWETEKLRLVFAGRQLPVTHISRKMPIV